MSDHGARNEGERIVVIANPRGAGGRVGMERARIEAAVSRAFAQATIRWTTAPEDATRIAREVATDADIVAAVGGDGTCHEVVNGLFEGSRPLNPKVVFTVIPFGTGGDLVRSLEIPKRLEDALWIAATGVTLPMDVGELTWASGASRLFINVAGFGINAEVCRIANASSKRWGGAVTFLGATARALASWTPRRASWRWTGPDGDGALDAETLSGFVANGHYCGAGMWVGAGGRMNDGVFELTVLPPLGAVGSVVHFPKLRNGRLVETPGAVRARVWSVEVGELPVETDGEPREAGPLRARVLPAALQIRGGWLRPPGSAS
jgi:diacylglycerol kinase family enzyme